MYEIQPVTLNDCETVADIILKANWGDPFVRIAYPTATFQDRVDAAAARLPRALFSTNTWHLKVTDEANDTAIAYSKWILPAPVFAQLCKESPPDSITAEQKESFEQMYKSTVDDEDCPIGINMEMVLQMDEAMNEARRKFPTSGSYIMLDRLETLPAYQRRGAGSMMLKWGTELADKHSLHIGLEAMPAGVPIYKKHGFRSIAEVTHDTSRWGGPESYTHVLMIRDPASVPIAK